MKMVFRVASAVLALAAATPALANTVITFDSLSGSGTVPATFQGVNFGSNFTYYDSPQYPYTPKSGATRIFGNYDIYPAGAPSSISFSFASQTFVGLWVSGASQGTVSFDLYDGATLVGSSASIVSTGTPAFLASNYAGAVTSVSINALNGYSVYDDLTLGGASVPEPATWALMIAGFGIAGGAMRRRARVKTAVSFG